MATVRILGPLKGESVTYEKDIPAFIDTRIGEYTFQMLVDSGNLSRVNMLDQNVYSKLRDIFPRLKLEPISEEVRTAGHFKLNGLGEFETEVKFGSSNAIYPMRFHVVRNLGSSWNIECKCYG